MLRIKLQRIGKKHQPSYRLVVAEKRSKLNAPPVEDLGSYNPFTKNSTMNLERIAYWLQKGAQPTATAHNLLVREKAMDSPKIRLNIKAAAKAEVPAEAAPAAPEIPAETAAEKPAEAAQ